MAHFNLKERCGFSLLETISTVLLFSVIFATLIIGLTQGKRAWQIGQTQTELRQKSRLGLQAMVNELRQAIASTISLNPAGALNGNQISFCLPADIDHDGDVLDASGNLEFGLPIQYSLGGLNQHQLLRTDAAGNSTVLMNNVNAVQFNLDHLPGPDRTEITVGTQRNTLQGHSIAVALRASVNFRN